MKLWSGLGPLLVMGLALGAAVHCGGSSSSTMCRTGAERCTCFGNNTCDVGLVCLSERCVVKPGNAGGAAGGVGVGGDPGSGGTGVGGAVGTGGIVATGGAVSTGGTGVGGALGTGGVAAGGTVATGGIDVPG